MKGKVIFTVFFAVAYIVFAVVWTQLTDVVRAQAGVGQFSNDPVTFAASRALARYDVIGDLVAGIFVIALLLIWFPVIVRALAKKKSASVVILFALSLGMILSACKPFKGTKVVEVAPNQTAFLLPAVGDTGEQTKFGSAEFLNQNKVAAKIVEITYREHKVGRAYWSIDFVPNQILILVDRSPVSRQWTYNTETGTATANQAIALESRESIGFYHGVVVNAVIEEDDSATFLYYYGGAGIDQDVAATGVQLTVGLEQVMDTFVRTWVADKLYAEFKSLPLEQCQIEAGNIFARTEDLARTYFKKYGITILDLGGIEGLVYDSDEVQNTINQKFERAAQATSQAIENQRQIDISRAGVQIAQSYATQTVVAALAQAEALQKQGEKLAQYPGLTNWVLANASKGYVPQILVMQGDGSSSVPFPFWFYPPGTPQPFPSATEIPALVTPTVTPQP